MCYLKSLISTFPYLDDSSFTEGNVLNAIEEVSDIKELGLLLGLKEATIKELDGYPVLHRKQKLVSRLFRIKHKCNWKTLHEAINQVKIDKGGEFNQRKFTPIHNSCCY